MHNAAVCFLVGIVSLSFACATTTTTRTVWTELSAGDVRDGRVEWVKESVTRTEGDPGAGAVAGAIVGGVLGQWITGRRSGAAVGAATGAIIGANESQGFREDRRYDVLVRFDDGAAHVFSYQGAPPFRPGQPVRLTSRGLIARGEFIAAPEPPPADSPEPESSAQAIAPETPEPVDTPPPPIASTTQAPPAPTVATPNFSGRWAYTQQYGWVWMPYGSAYTFTSHYQNGDPYMYVYYPRRGWTWVEAPWLWGWGGEAVFQSWHRSQVSLVHAGLGARLERRAPASTLPRAVSQETSPSRSPTSLANCLTLESETWASESTLNTGTRMSSYLMEKSLD